MKKSLHSLLLNLLPTQDVFAHCDAPCGIYDPKPAQIAAATVKRMVEKIEDLPAKEVWTTDDHANFVRFIWTKEEHARRCKEELLMLWTDYCKPEHVEKFPQLHETFWKAAKLCSQNKQHVSKDLAQQLIDAVNTIADIFNQTKAAK
jgi:nickel superoxide dismutase